MLRSIGIAIICGALSLAAPACQFDETGLPGTSGGDDDPTPPDIDQPPGVLPPPGDDPTCWTWAVSVFDPCDTNPGGDIVIGGGTWTYDTDTGVMHSPNGDETTPSNNLVAQTLGPTARMITASSITISEDGKLRVVGSRPLIIASWSTLDVLGTIDASSRVDEPFSGAGSEPTMCAMAAPTPGQDRADGAGGGGGGAFAGKGGNGGDGRPGTKGTGGTKVEFPGYVRGGCAGAAGGATQIAAGDGSPGGGAVHLVAKTQLTISGMVEAGGAGGGAGLQGNDDDSLGSGGGGAGSGGYIGIESESVTLTETAIVAANGGGGGEAGDDEADGDLGDDGLIAMIEALGGAGAAEKGGNGGNGGYLDKPDGKAGKKQDVGGGGGGGAGFVALRAFTQNVPLGTVSPNPTTIAW